LFKEPWREEMNFVQDKDGMDSLGIIKLDQCVSYGSDDTAFEKWWINSESMCNCPQEIYNGLDFSDHLNFQLGNGHNLFFRKL
jgi:hypothetical protein